MIYFLTFLVVLVVYGFIRLLHLASYASAPNLISKPGSKFMETVLDLCPIFKEAYIPPLLWGKSGHLQTFIYAKLGRVGSRFPHGERHEVSMPDGATMTYDIFPPHKANDAGGDYTILVCPGIANHSESSYICTFVNYAQDKGYRVVVLNHLGAVPSVPLTSPRIFSYGGTIEFHTMVQQVKQRFPTTHMIACGFSMGANIVVKYLGESKANEQQFVCCMSICQGYDINHAARLLMEWSHMRRAYIYVMTSHQKSLLRNHYGVLMGKGTKDKHNLDEEKILTSTSLLELDEQYSRRVAGFPSVEDYYTANSSANFINNIEIPMFILNAEDDPIVPTQLLKVPKDYAESHDKSLLVITRHGGHLGYFEGRLIVVDSITWLDKAIIQYADAIALLHSNGDL